NIAVFAKPARVSRQAQSARLVSLLPASDAVVVFDSKRFLGDALPKVLSANQPMLGEIMAKVAEVESRTGIDLRKFDQVAVGATIKPGSGTNFDGQTVAIASGDINAGALISVAKLASKGTYREEKIGDRTVYVFSAKDVVQKTSVTVGNSKIARFFDEALKGLTRDVAVASLDRNTLVLGAHSKVRETLEGKSRITADISSLLPAREAAVVTFAMKTPAGLSKLLPLDNDELGANIDSIRYVSGWLDVTASGATLQMLARATRPDQAAGLKETLEGLQMIGGAFLGSSKRADQQVYGRMIKNARFEARGTDLTLDLTVSQSDIDILIGGMK
ncbi:MAG TPA: hypothetical protein VNA17_08315, partial [Pyrinomonadaceae bacterium]|nr:hypothetical protein [Pyrinomonadaceae bacterium]